MRLKGVGFALAAAFFASDASAQFGASHLDSIGIPMKPGEAGAGPWTLSTGRKDICQLRFGTVRGEGGLYPADITPDCGAVLPPGIAGWKPVTDGLALVNAQGAILVDFNRITSRDLVAPRSGAPFLELKR
jgi:hypothetical protein